MTRVRNSHSKWTHPPNWEQPKNPARGNGETRTSTAKTGKLLSGIREMKDACVTMRENSRTVVRQASQAQKGTHHTNPFSVWGTGCNAVVQGGLDSLHTQNSSASASLVLGLLPATPYLATNPLIPTLGTHEVNPQCQRQLSS